jgi:hypothetical protein
VGATDDAADGDVVSAADGLTVGVIVSAAVGEGVGDVGSAVDYTGVHKTILPGDPTGPGLWLCGQRQLDVALHAPSTCFRLLLSCWLAPSCDKGQLSIGC